jgi:hypothetical protein
MTCSTNTSWRRSTERLTFSTGSSPESRLSRSTTPTPPGRPPPLFTPNASTTIRSIDLDLTPRLVCTRPCSLRSTEIAALSAPPPPADDLEEFYARLVNIKEFHRKNPEVDSRAVENEIKGLVDGRQAQQDEEEDEFAVDREPSLLSFVQPWPFRLAEDKEARVNNVCVVGLVCGHDV